MLFQEEISSGNTFAALSTKVFLRCLLLAEKGLERARTTARVSDLADQGKKMSGNLGIAHTRWATHGKTDISNCHPFRMGRDNLTYLGHNGILSVLEDDKDHRSDTRIFAEDILPSIGGISALDNPKIFNLVEGFSVGSKLAFMTLDDSAEHDIYMVNERLGFTDVSGIWWSNRTCYLTPKYSYGGYLDMGLSLDKSCADDNSFGYTCMMCETVQEVKISDDAEAEYFCTACQSCLDCGMYKTECMCYTPAHAYWLGR